MFLCINLNVYPVQNRYLGLGRCTQPDTHMRTLNTLRLQDLKCMVFSLIGLHFKIKPIWNQNLRSIKKRRTDVPFILGRFSKKLLANIEKAGRNCRSLSSAPAIVDYLLSCLLLIQGFKCVAWNISKWRKLDSARLRLSPLFTCFRGRKYSNFYWIVVFVRSAAKFRSIFAPRVWLCH